jgi:L,D-transpeptidase ErfK/SrfK
MGSLVKLRFACLFAALACVTAPDAGARAEDPEQVLVGGVVRHVVVKGESLRSLGARFGVDSATLAHQNDITARGTLRVGQILVIDNRHIVPEAADGGALVVNIPQRMLFLTVMDRTFSAPVAVGSRGWQTPISDFTILVKETDPIWDVPASIAAEARAKGRSLPAKVPPGPQNPLGRHWLGLSVGGIGIHGTNAPSSIYAAVTHGCIRVHPDDVARLFDLVTVGTPGMTIYEPILMAEGEDGRVYLEIHPDVYRRLHMAPLAHARAIAEALGLADRIDWTLAENVIRLRHGIARDVTVALPPERGADRR